MILLHTKETIHSVFNVAQIHASRLRYAMTKLASRFPLSAQTVLALTDEELPVFELLTGRFSKLQDLMGNALFPKLLQAVGDLTESMTFIDKLNRLEKLGVIDHTQTWLFMRQMRNHLAHEYPDQPTLTAEYLNQTFELSKQLLVYLDGAMHFAKDKDLV